MLAIRNGVERVGRRRGLHCRERESVLFVGVKD